MPANSVTGLSAGSVVLPFAWIVSLAVAAASVAIVPLMPWLLFWSYLTISHLFLQVLGAVPRAESVSVYC